LLYTVQHRRVLIIFPFVLQTIITAQMLFVTFAYGSIMFVLIATMMMMTMMMMMMMMMIYETFLDERDCQESHHPLVTEVTFINSLIK